MKKLLIAVILLCYLPQLNAQRDRDPFYEDSYETETLFNKARIVGAFGGPFFEYSRIGGDLEVSSGGGGALIINDFFIGAYGMGTDNINILNGDLERIEMGHGGLWLGYTYKPHKLLHAYTSLKLGVGGLDIEFDNGFDYDDEIFVTTPEIGLELNIFRFFKLGFTGGYRFVAGYDEPVAGFDQDELNGPTGTITLRFGGFGNGRRW